MSHLDQQRDAIRVLLSTGPILPHPKWTKAQCLEYCHSMYKQMDLIRAFLFETALVTLDKRDEQGWIESQAIEEYREDLKNRLNRHGNHKGAMPF